MLSEFQRLYLDLDQTRERVVARIATDAGIAAELAQVAELALATVERKLAQIEEDYLSQVLSATTYERLSSKLADQATAALAERDRARTQAKALAEARPLLDAEAMVLRQLAELRTAIIERDVGAATSLDGLRRILHTLFEEVVYRPADHQITELADYHTSVAELPGAFLEPHLRKTTIVGYTDEVRPIIRKTALPLETEAVGLPSTSSAPRSSSRVRCTASDALAVSAITGTSRSRLPARSLSPRMASISPRVSPFTSTTIASTRSSVRIASAPARELALRTRYPSAVRLSAFCAQAGYVPEAVDLS